MNGCGNCRKKWHEGDKYCRYCGAPKGTPVYISEATAMIYGPLPIKRTHRCSVCNFSWEANLMVDKEAYCPECGNSAPSRTRQCWVCNYTWETDQTDHKRLECPRCLSPIAFDDIDDKANKAIEILMRDDEVFYF